MSGASATQVSSPCGSFSASQAAAPETTVPVEPPNRNPREARLRQVRVGATSSSRGARAVKGSSTRGGRARVPWCGVGVLVEPGVAVVVVALGADVVHGGAEHAAGGRGLGDDVDPGAEGFHQLAGGEVAAVVGDADELVAAAGGDHGQGHAEV